MATVTRHGAGLRAAWRQVLLVLAVGLGLAPCAAPAAPEYQVKAVFLFNFSQFVEWPPEVFATDHAPFTICVLGDDPFGGYLDDVVRSESVSTHPIQTLRLKRVEDAGGCHIVYVSSSEQQQLPGILAALRHRSILTVSDGEQFALQGGMISFISADNRIRLGVNVDAARAANLKLSSKLLRSCTLVAGSGGEP